MQDRQMGLLNNILNFKSSQYSDASTTSGIGKEQFDDWAAMTEEQRGYFSALTMSKNIRGAALSFRCRAKDKLEMFTLSMSGKSNHFIFEKGRHYKARLHFENSIILYASLHAYKENMQLLLMLRMNFLSTCLIAKAFRLTSTARITKE
jgi:hypothetical protein